ncbi:hypothetical protein ISCGN_015616 [Ixodes scapularis]
MAETPQESMDQDPRDKSVRDHEPPGDSSELQGSRTYTTGEGSGSFQDCSTVQQDEGNNLPWTEILRRRDKRRSARNLQKPDNVPEASTRESVRSNMAADTGKGGKNRISPSASPKSPAKNGGFQTKRKPVAERLPPLPRDHYKVVIRPFDGLTLAEKAPQEMMNALATACGLREQEGEDSTLRIRKDQNLMIFSTPNVGTAERMARVKHLSLNGQDYDIGAYIAAPDDSCRGVITKIGFGFSTEYLTEKIRPMGPEGPRVLNARMMGKSDAALITFQGIRVPRFVRFGMVECRCKPYFPKEQVCDVCLGLGHRRDVCPYPEQNKCSTCGLLNGDMEEHECSPYCIHCKGQHPSNDPKCPARKREPYNKGRLQDQQRAEQQQRRRQFKGTKEQQSQNNTNARQPLQQWQRQLSPPTMTSQFHWPALESRGVATTNPYALLANAGPESYAAALTQAPGWNPGNQHFYHGPRMGIPVPSEYGPAPGTSGKKKKPQKKTKRAAQDPQDQGEVQGPTATGSPDRGEQVSRAGQSPQSSITTPHPTHTTQTNTQVRPKSTTTGQLSPKPPPAKRALIEQQSNKTQNEPDFVTREEFYREVRALHAELQTAKFELMQAFYLVLKETGLINELTTSSLSQTGNPIILQVVAAQTPNPNVAEAIEPNPSVACCSHDGNGGRQ